MSTPSSGLYPLFEHMANEHGLTLLDSELNDIVSIVMDMQRAAMVTVITPDTTDAISRALMPAESKETDHV